MTLKVIARKRLDARLGCRESEDVEMRVALFIVIALFGGFTVWVVSQVGYLGFFRSLLSTAVGWQAFTDLCISLVLFIIWMSSDAKQAGRSPWSIS